MKEFGFSPARMGLLMSGGFGWNVPALHVSSAATIYCATKISQVVKSFILA